MSRFEVSPEALRGAAGTLGAVRGELDGSTFSGGVGTGEGSLDGALGALSARLASVAAAMGEAVSGTCGDLQVGADSYAGTDDGQFRGGGR